MPTVRKRGKTWQVQVRIKEGTTIVYQESTTRDTKQAATLWGYAREAEIKAHGWQKRVVAKTTLKKVLETYIEARYSASRASRGVTHSMENLAYDEDIGDLTLDQLTSDKIVAWARKRQEKGNAPATVMHHLAILRAGIAATEGMLNVPTEGVVEQVRKAIAVLKQLRIVAPSKKMDNRITDEDLAKILPTWDNPTQVIPMVAIVKLALALPRRREELLTMEWKHLTDDTIKLIDTKDPRRYREETIPLPPAAAEIIKRLPRIDARILPYKPESVSASWQRAVRKVGLPHLRYHDLRHEGISRLFESGNLSIEEVALISGHTSWTTLKRYTHLRPEDVTAKLRSKQ